MYNSEFYINRQYISPDRSLVRVGKSHSGVDADKWDMRMRDSGNYVLIGSNFSVRLVESFNLRVGIFKY